MKQYRFKLETVLEYRSRQADEIHQQLAQAEAKKGELLNSIDQCTRNIETAFQERTDALLNSQLDQVLAENFSQYVDYLYAQKAAANQKLIQQEKQIVGIRLQLQQAIIKKKALETLKEKDTKKFLQKIQKAEEQQLEEISQYRQFHLKK